MVGHCLGFYLEDGMITLFSGSVSKLHGNPRNHNPWHKSTYIYVRVATCRPSSTQQIPIQRYITSIPCHISTMTIKATAHIHVLLITSDPASELMMCLSHIHNKQEHAGSGICTLIKPSIDNQRHTGIDRCPMVSNRDCAQRGVICTICNQRIEYMRQW